MKQKLLDLLAKLKPLASKAYAASPALVGLCVGYFGHGPIQLGINIAAKLVATLLG